MLKHLFVASVACLASLGPRIVPTSGSAVVALLAFAGVMQTASAEDTSQAAGLYPKVRAIYAPAPNYPRRWAAEGLVGEGLAVLTVDPQSGLVTQAYMLRSTGHKLLDDSALEAFRQWRFKPDTVSKAKIPITFINYSFEKWFMEKHGYPPAKKPKPNQTMQTTRESFRIADLDLIPQSIDFSRYRSLRDHRARL
jgi:TonB family protein